MVILLCDVCDSILYNPICDKCGYNNYYQFGLKNKIEVLSDFIDIEWLDDDTLRDAIIEYYGLSEDEILKITLLSELDGLTIEDLYTDYE